MGMGMGTHAARFLGSGGNERHDGLGVLPTYIHTYIQDRTGQDSRTNIRTASDRRAHAQRA